MLIQNNNSGTFKRICSRCTNKLASIFLYHVVATRLRFMKIGIFWTVHHVIADSQYVIDQHEIINTDLNIFLPLCFKRTNCTYVQILLVYYEWLRKINSYLDSWWPRAKMSPGLLRIICRGMKKRVAINKHTYKSLCIFSVEKENGEATSSDKIQSSSANSSSNSRSYERSESRKHRGKWRGNGNGSGIEKQRMRIGLLWNLYYIYFVSFFSLYVVIIFLFCLSSSISHLRL